MRKTARTKKSAGRAVPTRHGLLVPSLLIAILTCAIYAPVRHYGFVTFDDGAFVVDNPHVASGLSEANVRWAFANAYAGTGGPITWISHMLDVQWFGLNAGPQHVTNVVLHVATALLLLWVLATMTGAVWRSALVAALFAVHPAHVESVAWIAERKDVLSTFFWMLTMAAYLGYVRRPGVGRYACTAACLTLGLLAKPMLVTLPAVLLLLDVWPLARFVPGRDHAARARTLLIEKLPLAAPAIAAIAMTYIAQRDLGAVSVAQPIGLRLENAALSAVKYLGMMAWPAHLAVFYPYPVSVPAPLVMACVATLALLTTVAWRVRRRWPFVTVGWCWYVVTLVPVIGFVQVGGHAMADRFTYVPSIGIFVAAGWALEAAVRAGRISSPAAAIGAAAVLVSLSVSASRQVATWQDSASLWSQAIAVTADNDRAHANLGVTLALRGDRAGAIANYRESLRINPAQPETQNNLALLLTEPSERDEAEAHYREAIRLDPGYANAHGNLAVLLGDAGRFAESLGEVQTALRLRPDEARWHLMAGDLLMEEHRRPEAIAEAETALRLDPTLTGASQAAAEWALEK